MTTIPFPGTRATCLLPVKDMQRARHFDEGALGLDAVGATPDGTLVYRCGGTEIALFPRAEGTAGTILCLHEDLA